MEIGTMATSASIALMVLAMLIYVGFYTVDEKTRSGILWATLQAFQAGLIVYIIQSQVTYEVANENLVTACIIPLMFLMAYFDFKIDMDERKRQKS